MTVRGLVAKRNYLEKDWPVGLFFEKENSRVWVKTWSEFVRECDSRLHFIQDKLRVVVSADEIEERIIMQKASLQGARPGKVVQLPKGASAKAASAT